MIGRRWAATAVAAAYVGYRCVAWLALVGGGFPPSAVPFLLVAVAVAVDLAFLARLPDVLRRRSGAALVGLAGAGGARLQAEWLACRRSTRSRSSPARLRAGRRCGSERRSSSGPRRSRGGPRALSRPTITRVGAADAQTVGSQSATAAPRARQVGPQGVVAAQQRPPRGRAPAPGGRTGRARPAPPAPGRSARPARPAGASPAGPAGAPGTPGTARPAAPPASAVRQATRAPELRPPNSSGRRRRTRRRTPRRPRPARPRRAGRPGPGPAGRPPGRAARPARRRTPAATARTGVRRPGRARPTPPPAPWPSSSAARARAGARGRAR